MVVEREGNRALSKEAGVWPMLEVEKESIVFKYRSTCLTHSYAMVLIG